MSGDKRETFNYESFDDPYSFFGHNPGGGYGDLHGFEAAPPTWTGFSEYLLSTADYGMLSRSFDLSFSSKDEGIRDVEHRTNSASEVDYQIVNRDDTDERNFAVGETGLLPSAANYSSPSSSSVDMAGEEDFSLCENDRKKHEDGEAEGHKVDETGCQKDKNTITKLKKKGEKRQREQRFAFMTKSEVDHLEDGYRWRKYGQKAVKNSPYPRSYYRCTTLKCAVKKRVERSNQDPSIVVTTYEGKHTHHCPSNLRGSSHLLANQSSANARAQIFPQLGLAIPSGSEYGFLETQYSQYPNYDELLLNIIPSSIIKRSQR